MKKKLYRLFLILAGFFLILTLAGSLLVYIYKGDIREYTLNYLNKNLNARVQVGTVDISMLRHFPYISATFREVTIMSSTAYLKEQASPDTLLHAGEVILDINIYKILIKKDIKIERVLVEQGRLNLAKGKNGKKNWDILKSKPDNNKGEKINIRLFRLTAMDFGYRDMQEGLYVQGKIGKGEWNEGFMNSDGGGRLVVDLSDLRWSQKGKKELAGLKKARLSLVAGRKDGYLQIDKGKLKVEDLPELSFDGKISGDETMEIDMNLSTGRISPQDVLAQIKKSERGQSFPDPQGKVWITGRVQAKEGHPFTWTARLSARGEGHVLHTKEGTGAIRIPSWKGTATLKSSGRKVRTVITIDPVKVKYGASDFTAKVSWNNEDGKYVTVTGSGKASLEDANILFGNNRTFRSGTGVPHVQVKIPVEVIRDPKKGSWKKIRITGDISLQDFRVYLPGPVQGKRAEVKILPGHILGIRGKEIHAAGSQWEIDGKVYHLDDYIEKKSAAVITGTVSASTVRMKDIVEYFKKSGEQPVKQDEENTENRLSPVFVNTFHADTFLYEDVKVSGLTGKLTYRNPVLEMRDLSFRTVGGKVNGQMDITFLRNGDLFVKTYGEADHINVNELFRSFHNFDQDFIRAENLRGWLSGNIAFQATFDSTGRVRPATILSDSYLSLEQGALINFEPLYKLSKFIRLSELKNIKFSGLQNEIFITDSRVVIPAMKVSSSALDLDIAGTHYFDKHFEYRIRVYLSDYLARKAQKANNKKDLDLVVEPGERNTSLFLIYTGDENSSRIAYDKKRARRKISEDLKKEKEEFKDLFRKEKSGKDTLLYRTGKEGEKKIRVVWPEEEPEKNKKQEVKDTSAKKKFRVIWEEEPDSVPKKENIYR